MKRYFTDTIFYPLNVDKQSFNLSPVLEKDGKRKLFKTRKGVEAYCKKNNCVYCELKHIFYR